MGSTCNCFYKTKPSKDKELFPLQSDNKDNLKASALKILIAFRNYKKRKLFFEKKKVDFNNFLSLIQTFKSPNEVVEQVHSKLLPFNFEFLLMNDFHYLIPEKIVLDTTSAYLGYWLKNKRDGCGVQIWIDGSKFEGNWKNNKTN